jgi:hypothetical protein
MHKASIHKRLLTELANMSLSNAEVVNIPWIVSQSETAQQGFNAFTHTNWTS